MRFLFCVFIINVCLIVRGQSNEFKMSDIFDCSNMITEIDHESVKKVSNKHLVIQKGKSALGVTFFKTKENLLIVNFKVATTKCFDEKTRIKIQFEDGPVLDLDNKLGKQNCEGELMLAYPIGDVISNDVILLRSKHIETISVKSGDDYFFIVTLPQLKSAQFLHTMSCLSYNDY